MRLFIRSPHTHIRWLAVGGSIFLPRLSTRRVTQRRSSASPGLVKAMSAPAFFMAFTATRRLSGA